MLLTFYFDIRVLFLGRTEKITIYHWWILF